MPTRIHYRTEIKIDIYSDIATESKKLITDMLRKVWPDTPLFDLDVEDYIDLSVDLWTKYYINSDNTKEAIEKIKNAQPPKNLKIYLVFNPLTDDDFLIADYSEVRTTPLFRAYLPTGDLWDTYSYDIQKKKFESLEIIEPAYIDEIKSGMSGQEKANLDEIILQAYGFHNRLMGLTAKKRLLYTAQPPDRVSEWNKKGIIPKGTYFTDKMSRAEYFWENGDIIVDYRLPEDKLSVTSEFGGAKEYVTIEDIFIK